MKTHCGCAGDFLHFENDRQIRFQRTEVELFKCVLLTILFSNSEEILLLKLKHYI